MCRRLIFLILASFILLWSTIAFLLLSFLLFPQKVAYFRGLGEYSLNGVRCHKIENVFEYFNESSEFKLPSNAEVILHCDDHSGFHWDGEYYAAFDLKNKENINSYLNYKPWGTSWERGLVPKEVTTSTGLLKEFPDIFSSSEIWYLLDATPSFYNFRIMIIDPQTNKVFYSKWDS